MRYVLAFTASVLLSDGLDASANVHEDDHRQVLTHASPSFLRAVGKVTNLKYDGTQSTCSGSLVNENRASSSRYVVTAAHCQNLHTTTLEWSTLNIRGQKIRRSAEVVHLDSAQDWALLILDQDVSVNDVPPLQINAESDLPPDKLYQESDGELGIYVAGYSADREIGRSGTVLTYEVSKRDTFGLQRGHKLMEPKRERYGYNSINAFIFQGASGGAIIYHYDIDLDGKPEAVLVGTVNGGYRDSYQHNSSNGARGGNLVRFTGYHKYQKKLLDLID